MPRESITITYHVPGTLELDLDFPEASRASVLELDRGVDEIAVEVFSYAIPPSTFDICRVDPMQTDGESPVFATLEAAVTYAHRWAWAFTENWAEIMDGDALSEATARERDEILFNAAH